MYNKNNKGPNDTTIAEISNKNGSNITYINT